jgi:mannose/fructose/N-acetylgalactosamine-specific phosphotransferase system component IIC
MLPALGIALLMNYIIDGESMPYMFLGFVLAAYLGLNSLGVAAIGLIIAVIYYNTVRKKQSA